MAGGASDARGVPARLLSLLDAFDREGASELSLADLVARTGLPRSTAHRLAGELVAWGGLERTAEGGYQLGRKLWRLGSRNTAVRTLRQVAHPFLEDLLELTRQNVQLAVLDRLAALYLERLTTRDSVMVLADVGRRLPLHATGVGLVLLGHAPESLLEAVLATGPRRFLPATMTTPEELRARLAEIRRRGIAVTHDEMTVGAASVAAPVRDAAGTVTAAVSIIVPSRAPIDPRYELAVRLAAAGISRGLGWQPRPASH